MEPRYKLTFAHAFGRLNAAVLRALFALLKPFEIRLFFTDYFNVCGRTLPRENHVVSKRFTQ
ncbi:IS1 family transposase [Grimontia marina]|uniref:IS1 family transposase n=1 Tax=Grimontia marina TaxID=646534 RepID=UPI0009FD31E4